MNGRVTVRRTSVRALLHAVVVTCVAVSVSAQQPSVAFDTNVGMIAATGAPAGEAAVTHPLQVEPAPGRLKLYAAGIAGQVAGAGIGWVVGQGIGQDCSNNPDVMCEAMWPTGDAVAALLASTGAFILPPITVHLANRSEGSLAENYFTSAVLAGTVALIARKNPRLWCVVPVAQLVGIVESEIAVAVRNR